jgi:hypothetical protein
MRPEFLAPHRTTIWILAAVMSAIPLTTGCSSSSHAMASATEIIIFVDFSASIHRQDRTLFKQAIENQIVPSLSAGDRLLIAPITDKTLTEFHPLIDATLPPNPEFNGWLNNVLKYKQQERETRAQVTQLKETIRTQVANVFASHYSSPYTDIFSSLLIAQKLFHNAARRKVLVLMSDMIEDYPPYNFEKIAWNTTTVQRILSELDVRGQVPNLSGVCIYVSGASAQTAEMAENMGRFWQAYFQRTQADMDPSRYAHVLLHWPPSTSCSL